MTVLRRFTIRTLRCPEGSTVEGLQRGIMKVTEEVAPLLLEKFADGSFWPFEAIAFGRPSDLAATSECLIYVDEIPDHLPAA